MLQVNKVYTDKMGNDITIVKTTQNKTHQFLGITNKGVMRAYSEDGRFINAAHPHGYDLVIK
jgi:hypothetical protein